MDSGTLLAVLAGLVAWILISFAAGYVVALVLARGKQDPPRARSSFRAPSR